MSSRTRSLRAAILGFAFVALAATVAASCTYTNPPVMTIAANGEEKPFFTMTWDDLQGKLSPADPTAAAAASTTTKPASYPSGQISQILTQTVQEELINQLVAQNDVQVTNADKAAASASSSSGTGQEPSETDINVVALSRWAAEQAFASGKIDKSSQVQQTFEANKETYGTPDQVCVHGVFVLPNPSGSTATDEQMQAALTTAAGYKQRLQTEDFAKVADEVNPTQAQQQYPGGEIGCIGRDRGGFDDAQWATLTKAAPGTVVDPMDLGGSLVIVFRLDEFKPGHEATLDEVRTKVESDTTYAIGRQLIGDVVRRAAATFVVVVDPHFGVWDPETITVNPPEGPSQPTIPTTTTTTAPRLLPSTTTTAPTTTGSTPGSTPPGTGSAGTAP